ncbi:MULTISPECIES: heavy-metal-associated domain-containing protein [unclassified Roseateles]|uniref:heavy-metal-associated domain-containing protein n=1 Tax=unclassified Roseateles TaxID=2626991 RepID=UPI0006F230F3|nr:MULTISPECIES: heavy-metal-associated domain-containing protein [unclassified Roseateles]KQW42262.1 heavy metal transporter [Pelomonas sp. Root405]KRA68135.1 heavy metal transporter [Pelomonas sp. Root662]
MIAFEVKDMTCGHCVSMITKAVKGVDSDAAVAIDLASKRVEIGSSAASPDEFRSAIAEAGYTPTEATGAPAAPRAATGGGCCGCR